MSAAIPQPSTPFINGVQSKILSFCTEEWQYTIDIAHWSECSRTGALKTLKELKKRGLVEYKWDVHLGKALWRKTDGA